MSRNCIVKFAFFCALALLVVGCTASQSTPANNPTTSAGSASSFIPIPTVTQPTLPPQPEPPASPTTQPSPTQAIPTPVRGNTANVSAESEESLFDVLMLPFVNEANRRRAERAKSDPEFARRVETGLNANRVNFLLYGYGETHEPPNTEKAIIGSHTIVSYDTQTRSVFIVSLTHDIRAPEIERELKKRGLNKTGAVRIDQVYSVGGFKLMQQVLENATGLSIDFQVSFRETVMQDFIDSVFEGVVIDVPVAFNVHPFYLDGVKYEKGTFAQGRQKLSGRQVIQFIKTVPITEGYYGRDLEHNVRKHLVFTSLLQAIEKNYKETWFWVKGSTFVARQAVTGAIAYDFDPIALIVNNIGQTIGNLSKLVNKDSASTMPRIQKSIYIVDPAHGEGGVQWITANAAVNPITKKDIETGVYNAMDIEVPINANPYGDLVTEYWTSVRQVVRESITSAVTNEPARVAEDSSPPVLVPNQPVPIIFPKSGDIIARTAEQGHPTGYVIIGEDGKRTPIKEAVYQAYQDQSLSPDGTIRLVINNNAVLSQSTGNLRPPGTVVKADGKRTLLPPAVIGHRGLFGAVVQDGRDIVIFSILDSRQQATLYALPPEYGRIERVAWDSQTQENDLILTLRGNDQAAHIYRLSPVITYPLSAEVAKNCGIDPGSLNSCVFGYYRRMPKNLSLVSDRGEFSASVAR